MIDHEATAIALRTRLRGVSVCTTGTMALARTTTGYTRLTGSFITDGFRVGMELLEVGFPTNGYWVVKEVVALTLTIDGTLTASASAGSRSLTVGLPETRLWENAKPIRSSTQIEAPTSGRPYVSDEFVPGVHEAETFPAQSGWVLENGLYVVTLYGLSNTATAGIRGYAAAIAALFTPGTTIAVGSDTLRVGTGQKNQNPQGVRRSQITPIANGWSFQQLTVPWYAKTRNLVAA